MTNTTPRAVRIPDDLWNAAQTAAESNGETVSEVIRRSLTRYVARSQRRSQSQSGSGSPSQHDDLPPQRGQIQRDQIGSNQ